MQRKIKAAIFVVFLGLAGCSTVVNYKESECRVLEKSENGNVVLECYDKTLKKESRRDPK